MNRDNEKSEWQCPQCFTYYSEKPDPDEVENTRWCPDDAICICGHCRCTGDC